jgi:type IV pilus assembly protein PilB
MTTAMKNYSASAEGQIGLKDSGANGSTDLVDHLLKSGSLTDKQIEYARRVQSKLETSRPLLQVIKELKFITDEQIKTSIRENPVSMRIGGLLVEMGHIQASDLRRALAIQKEEKSKRKIGEILVDNRLIEEQVLVETLSLQHGLPYVEPEWNTIDRKLFARVPLKWYEKHHLLPIRADGAKIMVAFADPLNQDEHQAARQVFGDDIIPVVACKSTINEVVAIAQRGEMKKQISAIDEQFIVRLVEDIILAAIHRDASDVHIEPLNDHLRVRFRQDGVLTHFEDFPPETAPAVASRIKVLCEVDITERRRHQGGRFFFEHSDGQLDLRASFYVTVHGEKIVLRLLNRQRYRLVRSHIATISRRSSGFTQRRALVYRAYRIRENNHGIQLPSPYIKSRNEHHYCRRTG